jgi:hypothetical protein
MDFTATNLDELLAEIKNSELAENEYCELPVFGGETPRHVSDGIYSWDEMRVLRRENGEWRIEER